MGKSNFAEQIRNKETYLGIEFGSTRIKAVLAVIEPPGELMYIITSRFGSWDSKTSSWAITSSAEASSTCTPRKRTGECW